MTSQLDVESAVWRALATKVAHQSESFETDLQVICDWVRRIHQQTPVIVVPVDFPDPYDLGFPGRVVRSAYCPADTVYVVPGEDQLGDLFRTAHG